MSHTRTINPDSLRLLSGNVIMSQPRSYPYPKDVVRFADHSSVFNLVGYHDVQNLLRDDELTLNRYEFDDKLSVIDTNDNDPTIISRIERDTEIDYPTVKLIKERKLRMSDDDNVLYYLITLRPHAGGMFYGARHGIDRLFFAAKSRYFNKYYNDESEFKNFQDSVFYEFIPLSVKAGSVSIFKDCVKYLPSNKNLNYDEFLKVAVDHNRTDMVKYILTNGGHVYNPAYDEGVLFIASQNGDADLMKLLIHKLRSEINDVSVFEEQVFESAKITILNDRLEAFKFLLRYCTSSNRIKSLFNLCVKENKLKVFDVLVELHKDLLHDDNGRLLKKTIERTYNIMLYKLLRSLHYTEQTLLNILMDTVQRESISSYASLHDIMLDSLLRRINALSINREHVLSITKHQDVKTYLQDKWRNDGQVL